LLTWIYFSL